MRNVIDNILRKIIDKSEEVNILYFPYDGVFEQSLKSEKYKYYTMYQHQIHEFPAKSYPKNFYVLEDSVLSYITKLDLVIVNNRKDQLNSARNFANSYHIPLLLIDHELPAPESSSKLRSFVSRQFNDEDSVIAFDKLLSEEWTIKINTPSRYSAQIYENPHKTRNTNICLVGSYSTYDYGLLREVISNHSDIETLGINPGITKPYNTFDEMLSLMADSEMSVHIIQEHRPPLMMLYGMSLGCIPIINETRWTKYWITEDLGFLFRGISDIKKYRDILNSDKNKMTKMSHACIEFSKQFDHQNFQFAFSSFVDKVNNKIYNRESIL